MLRQPLLGLAGFGLAACLMPYTTVQLGVRITVSEALLGLAWLGVLPRLAVGCMQWPRGRAEQRLLWLMAFSLLPFLAGQLMVQADGNGPVNWARWLLNLSALFLAPLLLPDARSRDRLIVMLLLGTLAMLLLSIGYFLKDRDANSFIPVLEKLRYAHPEAVRDIFSANYTRMASPWVHPNLTGGALALLLPWPSSTAWRNRAGAGCWHGGGAAGRRRPAVQHLARSHRQPGAGVVVAELAARAARRPHHRPGRGAGPGPGLVLSALAGTAGHHLLRQQRQH